VRWRREGAGLSGAYLYIEASRALGFFRRRVFWFADPLDY
jgi:hypothetical protein